MYCGRFLHLQTASHETGNHVVFGITTIKEQQNHYYCQPNASELVTTLTHLCCKRSSTGNRFDSCMIQRNSKGKLSTCLNQEHANKTDNKEDSDTMNNVYPSLANLMHSLSFIHFQSGIRWKIYSQHTNLPTKCAHWTTFYGEGQVYPTTQVVCISTVTGCDRCTLCLLPHIICHAHSLHTHTIRLHMPPHSIHTHTIRLHMPPHSLHTQTLFSSTRPHTHYTLKHYSVPRAPTHIKIHLHIHK